MLEIPVGTIVYTNVNHVSKSGMTRYISAYVVEDGRIKCLDWHISENLGYRRSATHDGVKVGGCGMDMGFYLVYTLSSHLYPDGFNCIGEGCPSNDHSNGKPRDVGTHHNDGGYALRQNHL